MSLSSSIHACGVRSVVIRVRQCGGGGGWGSVHLDQVGTGTNGANLVYIDIAKLSHEESSMMN